MKILFDTDIGSDIDDALALLLLLRLQHVQLVGITTVYGNVDIRAKLAKKIVDAAGLNVPVVVGASTPVFSTMPVWHAGTEGVGVLSDEELTMPLEAMGITEGADQFIIEVVQEHGDELTVVCLGALTNLASALQRHPRIASRLSSVFFMGGGITYDRPVPDPIKDDCPYQADPSHNVRCDVQAAQEVFESGVPLTVLTNDVTTQLWWDGHPVQSLIDAPRSPEAKIVGKLLRVWLDYRSSMFEQRITGTCPHDPLTLAEAAGQSFVSYRPGKMTIHADAGTTFVPGRHGPHVAGIDVAPDEFIQWFSQRLGCAANPSLGNEGA